jgi:hypothetical protein
MGGILQHVWGGEKCLSIVVGKREKKRPLVSHRHI